MNDLLVTYGPLVANWVLAAVGSLVAIVIAHFGWSIHVQAILQRGWTEVKGAVMEVEQTYVSSIKQASADGFLSTNEKATAKSLAIQVAKDNLGHKGLERLERVLGVDVDRWIASKTEQAVAVLKKGTPPSSSSPDAVTIPLPRVPA